MWGAACRLCMVCKRERSYRVDETVCRCASVSMPQRSLLCLNCLIFLFIFFQKYINTLYTYNALYIIHSIHYIHIMT